MSIFSRKTLQKIARFNRQSQPKTGKRLFRTMKLESLSSRELMAADLGLIDIGLQDDAHYVELQTAINSKLDSAPAPFIGTALGKELGVGGSIQTSSQFVDAVGFQADEISLDTTATIADVKSQLMSAFGIAEDAITVVGQDGDSDIRFTVTLSGTQRYEQGVTLDLVGADPEIDLRGGGENQVELEMDWSYTLNFGVREVTENGQVRSEFYRDATPSSEVLIDFTATVKDTFTDGRGKVGVLFGKIEIDQDNPQQLSQFRGRYELDLSVGESGETLVTGTLTGQGEAHLDVVGSFAPSGSEALVNMGLTADGRVKYSTDIDFNIDGSVDLTDNQVEVIMENVTVDLGKIYTDFVDPLIGDLQNNLKPLKPIVDFLTEPLPVINDISQMAGMGTVTALSLAGYGHDHALTKTLRYLDAILDYRGLSGAGDQQQESLLSFSLSKSGLDSRSEAEQQADRESRLEHFRNNGLKIQLAEKHKNPEEHAEWKSSLAWQAEFGGSIDVPFLTDSDTLVGFLLGDTHSEFFNFDLDANFEIGLHVDIPIAPLLNMVSLVGGIDMKLGLELGGGYDATGINLLSSAADYSSTEAFQASVVANKDMLRNGFYLDDHNSAAGTLGGVDNGQADKPEATLSVEVGAGLQAGLDVIIASLTFEGKAVLDANLEFDLNDLPEPAATDQNGNPVWSNITESQRDGWTYDGRVRIPELTTIVDSNPGSLFNIDGKDREDGEDDGKEKEGILAVGMDAAVKAKVLGFTVYSESWELFRVNLIDEKISEPDDLITILGDNPPQLGSLSSNSGPDGGQVLTLFAGDRARGRNVEAGAVHENFTITSLGDSRDGGETLMVAFESESGETYTQFFHGVTKIVADGGSGDDAMTVLPGVTSSVEFDGGSGNDTLTALGSGDAILVGGSGDDKLRSGTGDGQLRGGSGADFLDGGNGNDVLYGGEGDDELLGGDGDDQLFGNEGADILRGQSGNDLLRGGADNDVLEGGLGADDIYGEGGEDRIQYAFTHEDDQGVTDKIRGGADVDVIEIYGSEAADRIQIVQLNGTDFQVTGATQQEDTGDFEDTSRFTFSLPETLEDRDLESIQVSGLGGDDELLALGQLNANELILSGGDGNDILIAADSDTTLLGDGGHDILRGGAGEDNIEGGLGNDEIHGGAGRDNLFGDDGDDIVYGGTGEDDIHGGSGDDRLWTGDENGTVPWSVEGPEWHDFISGGDGDDVLYGDRGFDELHGDAGNDLLVAVAAINDPRGDSLHGGEGDDILRGSQLDDGLRGGDGNDKIEHSAGDDVINGGGGELDQYVVFGTSGNDEITFEIAENGMGNPDIVVNVNGTRTRTDHHGIEVAAVDAGAGNDLIGYNMGVNAGLPGGIAIYAGAGNDEINLLAYQNNAIIDGGEGRDTLRAILNADDNNLRLDDQHLTTDQLSHTVSQIEKAVLTGNAASNVIDAGEFSGETALYGLDGDDTLVVGVGRDVVFGGAGIDTVKAEADVNLWLYDDLLLGLGRDTLDSIESAHLTGGEGNNHLTAVNFTKGGVTLNGGGGDDYLRGTDQGDELHGGDGRDFIYARAGNDMLDGGSGDDALFGNAGDDTMSGGDGGRDYLYGGEGNDHLIGHYDYLYGEEGDDELEVDPQHLESANYLSIGGAGNDIVRGGSGNDILNGNDGNDKLYGNGGRDVLYGGAGDDELHGGGGHDKLYGASGNDRLFGGSGNDTLRGDSGHDKLYGGSGQDVLYGGSGNDDLHGQTGNDRLYGQTNHDRLWGGSGHDYLDGGDDGWRDELDGGSGHDTANQHYVWVYTFGWFGYWKGKDALRNIERTV